MNQNPMWLKVWHELAMAIIDYGYIPYAVVEDVAKKEGWKASVLCGVFKALNIEVFDHDGEVYWRISDKVVPIVPRRDVANLKAARA